MAVAAQVGLNSLVVSLLSCVFFLTQIERLCVNYTSLSFEDIQQLLILPVAMNNDQNPEDHKYQKSGVHLFEYPDSVSQHQDAWFILCLVHESQVQDYAAVLLIAIYKQLLNSELIMEKCSFYITWWQL